MPTVKEYIKQLNAIYEPDDTIAVHLWGTDDAIGFASERNQILTQKEAEEVIENMHRKCDSELGLTWVTLEFWVDEIISNRKEIEEV